MPQKPNANTQIQDGFLTHTVNILRVAAGQRKEVLAMLEQLETDIAADVLASGTKTAFTQAKLNALLKQTQGTIANAYGAIADNQGKALSKIAQLEATKTVNVINATLGASVASVAMSPEQLASLASKVLVSGKHPAEWWAGQTPALQDAFMRRMRQGVAQGEGVDKLVQRVRGTKAKGFADGLMMVPKHQAEALVRTSVLTVTNEARIKTIEGQVTLGLAKGIQWLATLDSKTTPICKALDGKQWTLPGYKPVGHDKTFPGAIAHWQCFTGETPVSSPSGATKLYRRTYSGELITVKTDNGRQITATPNHPVLTPTGWKPIGKLHIGENLICQKRGVGSIPQDPQNQDVKTTFAELAKTTAELFGVLPVEVPISAPDFHGDGSNGEICQVWTYGALSDEGNATIAKLLGKIDLKSGNLDCADALPSGGGFKHLLSGASATLDRSMGRCDSGNLTPSPSRVQVIGATSGNSGRKAPPSQSGETDAELGSYFAGGHCIGSVEFDRVCVVIRSKAVSVFVHNLETDEGWYFADGVASHNCRSTQTPVLRSWEELAGPDSKLQGFDESKLDLDKIVHDQLIADGMDPAKAAKVLTSTRASMDGQVAKALNYEEWLKGKGEGFQNDVLGPARANLWRNGELTLAEMTDQNNNPLTLAELHKLIAENKDTLPSAEGDNGLNLAERKLLEQSLAAGIQKAEIQTHFLSQASGVRVSITGTAPTVEEMAKIAELGNVTVLSNTLHSLWTPQQLKSFSNLPGFQKAILVTPTGKTHTLQVLPGKALLPEEVDKLLAAFELEKGNPANHKLSKKFKKVVNAHAESVEFSSTDAGAVVVPPNTFNETFPALLTKPAPFYDPVADAAKAAKLKAEALAAEIAAQELAAKEAVRAAFDQADPLSLAIQDIAETNKGLKPADILAKAEAQVKAEAAAANIEALKKQAADAKKAGEEKLFEAQQKAADLAAAKRSEEVAAASDALQARQAAYQAGKAHDAAQAEADKAAAALAKIHAEAQAQIAEALAAKKGPLFSLGQQLPKTLAANPGANPAEILAQAKLDVETAKADSVKKQLVAGYKKNLSAGKPATKAQIAAVDALSEAEQSDLLADLAKLHSVKVAMETAAATLQAAEDAKTHAAATQAVADTKTALAPVGALTIGLPEPKNFPADPNALEVVRGLGGSTGAQLVKDKDGTLYVRKTGNSPAHVREEVLADALYSSLGANVPEAKLYDTAAGPVKLARFVEGQTLASYLQGATANEKAVVTKRIQEHFAIDALMGNWDVLGTGKDNVLIGKDGRVWRIDNGGSLRFRAQGQPKAPANWHEFSNEIWTMRAVYSTPTLKGLQTSIAAGFQRDFTDFYGSVSIYDIARQVKAWDPAALALLPEDLRPLMERRMGHLKAIGLMAGDLEKGQWKAEVADKMALSSMELRQAGVVARMSSKLTPKPGSPIMVDENGKEFDELRSKHSPQAQAVNPQDPFAQIFLQAIISINAHHKQGGTTFANMTKVDAVLAKEALLKAWKDHGNPAEKAVGAHYMPWLESIKTAQANHAAGTTKAQTGDVLPKFDTTAGAQIYTLHANPLAAKPAQPAGSITQDVSSYISSIGGNASAVQAWMGAQAGSSWAAQARAMKYFIATSQDKPLTSYFWHTGGVAASKAAFDNLAASVGGEANLRATFAAWLTYTQEILANTQLPNVDSERRVVLLVRTETDDVLKLAKIPIGTFGGVHTMQKAASESHGSVALSSIYGREVTVQAVPFANVSGMYITERPGSPGGPGSGGAGFLGDSENEYTANSNGIPFVYAGQTTGGTFIGIANGPKEWKDKLKPGFDLGPDATKWGVPLTHL